MFSPWLLVCLIRVPGHLAELEDTLGQRDETGTGTRREGRAVSAHAACSRPCRPCAKARSSLEAAAAQGGRRRGRARCGSAWFAAAAARGPSAVASVAPSTLTRRSRRAGAGRPRGGAFATLRLVLGYLRGDPSSDGTVLPGLWQGPPETLALPCLNALAVLEGKTSYVFIRFCLLSS